ncbi:MAG: sulfatase-like hydrolase/transferase [Labilithrix sp.]|nr:sulfatase-like hydrolase/transferase [Labilithrix sp.]
MLPRAGSARLRAGAVVAAAALAAASAGCSACAKSGSGDREESTTALAASATKPSTKGARATDAPHDSAVIDFLASAEDCSFGHRGVLVDLGDATTRARMSGARLARPDVEIREREGASWVSVNTRSLELSFVSASELKSEAGVVVEARVRGGLARSVSVYLNGKPIGTLALTKGETTVVSTRAQGVVARGTNELLLRFNGGSRSQREQLAEIDWIRVGPNDGDAPYSAPTRSDVVTTVSVSGTSRRSISLRAPGFARCSAFIPDGSVLEGFIGASGGEAEAEVRVLVDRAEPRVVGTFHLGGPTDPPGWRPISIPLGDVATIAGVELVAKTSSKGARVAFAEARVIPPAEPERAAAPPPTARGVILVTLGSTSRRLSLYGGSIAMPELASLANGGVVFDAHRATSSWATGALGSMLTGLFPREHGAADADGALSPGVFTVAEAARQAGIVTAMFTANPTTTAPYGFARGWETFVTRLPGEEDEAAVAVFDDVGRWLEAHKDDRFFLVVHARGGHPPWDVTSEELKELPPQNYQGSLEPKHAGEALAKARRAGGRSFADPDRERAFALHAKALVAHDAALGALVSRVRTIGREKDTVWIVTGDVGVDAAARVPFLEDDSLEEGALAVPLVLRGLDGKPREHVTTATSGVDVARTVLESFGLPPPPRLRGESLWSVAAQTKPTSERPLVAATATRFSARWGSFAVVGAREREVKVCNLALDPDCVSDVRPSHPLAAEALHSLAWAELVVKGGGAPTVGGRRAPTAEPAPAQAAADGPTSAALKVWGR